MKTPSPVILAALERKDHEDEGLLVRGLNANMYLEETQVYWKIEAVSHGKVTLDNLEVYWKPRDRALVAFTVYTNDVEGGMACADTDAQKASRYANHLNELKRRLNTEVKRREAERTK